MGLKLQNDRHTYRRYEHFSPSTIFAGSPTAYRDALYIGYEQNGNQTADDPHQPGRATSSTVGVWTTYKPSRRIMFDFAAGGHWFSSGDSSLVSLHTPYGEDSYLGSDDFTEPDIKFDPIGRFAIRYNAGFGWSLWALGYRQTVLPPLEAVYSPRAYLDPTPQAEGVMGNPDLSPERETGGEIGLSRVIGFAGRDWRCKIAAYEARLDDTITLATASYGNEYNPKHLLTYDNGGTLRQRGIHLETTSGSTGGSLWWRLAYDLSSTESNYAESAILDARWIYPDIAPGEYESEGYTSLLGGLYDAIGSDGWGEPRGEALQPGHFSPSSLDRPHRFSAAVVVRTSEAGPRAGWLAHLLRGWTTGAVVNLSSGRPYTPTYLYAAGSVPLPDYYESIDQQDPAWVDPDPNQNRNEGRMPATATLDLALTRCLNVGNQHLQISLEALNLLGAKNVRAVYRTTGEPDTDGADQYGWIPAGIETSEYLARLSDPRHYDQPFVFRAGIGLMLP